jgi:hypothetical protein
MQLDQSHEEKRDTDRAHDRIAQLAFALLEYEPRAVYGVAALICTGTVMAKFLTPEQRERIGELLLREAQKLLTPLH